MDNGITIRLDQIEKSLDREVEERQTAVKYISRLIEDVQSRYQDVINTFARIESAFKQHLEDDKKMNGGLKLIDERLRTVERLVWIAVGGIIVIGGIIALLGTHLASILR